MPSRLFDVPGADLQLLSTPVRRRDLGVVLRLLAAAVGVGAAFSVSCHVLVATPGPARSFGST